MEKQPEIPNQLAGQSSPYLLQHLYNPVNWHPWGDQALELARRENKPLLVSIGYSACHWCHVMEHESFEDQQVARLMNEHFVCIKVDREERPDIDHLYMNAVQLLSGQGGWPLNCFALPDGRPFWGGTYFPKQQWMGILTRIAQLYGSQYEQLVAQADEITRGVAQSSFIEPEKDAAAFSQPQAQTIASNILKIMDTREGGSMGAPKFPMPGNYEFLLHYYKHTGDEKSLDQVLLTLRKMAMGGIYDQVGGGFARYSTDETWKVPHFEKMLYDNAQLISLYSRAYKAKKDPLLKQVVFETIGFVSRDLISPKGTFYSALDADSEGQEGKYYVWSEKDFDDILGPDAPLVKKFYHVGGKGYWENGQNILLRNQTSEQFALQQGLDPLQWEQTIGRAKDKLLEVRGSRVPPGLDNKVLVGWNALMIRALSEAYAAFGEERFLQQAIQAADFILQHAMEPSGKLYRSLNGKVPAIDAFLEDYALLIRALISLYEVSMNTSYLVNASLLTKRVMKEFSSEETNLFLFSSKESEPLAAPFFEFHDGVIPSSNSVMAINLYYLSQYYENPEWDRHSRMMLGDMKKHLVKYSSSYSNWGILLLQQVYPFYTLAICGKQVPEVLPPVYQGFLPHVLLAPAISAREDVPLLKGRYREGETWFYLCRMGSCQLPVRTFEEVQQQMKGISGDNY